jgi:hypothetical protein
MVSHVSYTISAIVLCAILAENDKDLKLIPVERNLKKVNEIIKYACSSVIYCKILIYNIY